MPAEYKKAELRVEAKEEESTDGSGERQLVARGGALVQTGPLPPPEELAKFAAVSPAIAIDIVEMAKSALKHEQEMDSRQLAAGASLEKRAQVFGAAILLACLGAGTFLLYTGHWFGALPLVTAVLAAFASSVRNRREEKAAQQHPLPSATGRELPHGAGDDDDDMGRSQAKRRTPRKRKGR